MIYGSGAAVADVAERLSEDRMDKVALTAHVFIKPTMPAIGVPWMLTPARVCILASGDQIKQPMPNYFSLDESHQMHPENPPMPLVYTGSKRQKKIPGVFGDRCA